jgi:hypothetical protein
MTRLTCAETCKKVTQHYPDYFTFDVETWFENPLNRAYVEGENIGFAEWKGNDNFWVHFCFHTARGREAINVTKRMVNELFNETNFNSCVGLIHEDNKKARWLIRQVGFKSLGLSDTENGVCEMFYLTKEDARDGLQCK